VSELESELSTLIEDSLIEESLFNRRV